MLRIPQKNDDYMTRKVVDNMKSVIKGASYILAHTPEMVLDVDDIANEMSSIREQFCKY